MHKILPTAKTKIATLRVIYWDYFSSERVLELWASFRGEETD
jgi:hypothetical protein